MQLQTPKRTRTMSGRDLHYCTHRVRLQSRMTTMWWVQTTMRSACTTYMGRSPTMRETRMGTKIVTMLTKTAKAKVGVKASKEPLRRKDSSCGDQLSIGVRREKGLSVMFRAGDTPISTVVTATSRRSRTSTSLVCRTNTSSVVATRGMCLSGTRKPHS